MSHAYDCVKGFVLGTNATRVVRRSRIVTIEVSSQSSRILLTVEDSGLGFDRLSVGSGLGLPAGAHDALEHHGTLECGRSGLRTGRVNLLLPPPSLPMGRRAADATCPV